MPTSNRTFFRSWPMVATVLMAAFIGYGLLLVSQSRALQRTIDKEVHLLDELNQLNDALHQLGLTHRMDVGTRQYLWHSELDKVHERIAAINVKYSGSPGMAELPVTLGVLLHQTDSLHRDAMAHQGVWSAKRPTEAVFQFMLQRAQKAVDRTSRSVHEQGLGAHTSSLSGSWDKAQFLLIISCLLAIVFAWLVYVSNRLRQQTESRSQQLDHAKVKLERINQELRETMLSKEEKEVMLKEIHHRVKNNLQIVKSLIRFQMDRVNDPATTELFNECVNRVAAMALVHEQTYLSKDLANIDVNAYLAHLTRDLCYAYTIDTKLDLDIRINVPTLSVETLIPLGLIINEVISNSLKYAFKGRTKGTIMVHLDGSDEGGIHLRIGDDGVGLSDRTNWDRPKSLGMDLIRTLAGQLDTSIELVPGPGTVYELESIREERRKRA